jgi:hypothetical protein
MNARSKALSFSAAVILILTLIAAAPHSAGKGHQQAKAPTPAPAPEGPPVLWRQPADIATRDLYYGPGGKAHQPAGTFTFEKEDMQGTNPKFDVTDENGVKWKVKIGNEARPETAASRFVWAVGYFAHEDYFMPVLHVQNLPRLHRGGNLVADDGGVRNARLKRRLKDETKIGFWAWADNPFKKTREWYGLQVLMAVMNNWDLKDANNAIYQYSGSTPEQRYMVSDLGASFGARGWNWTKDNPEAYSHSHWIGSRSNGFVDFNVPGAPVATRFPNFVETTRRMRLMWLGRNVPVADAKWMGQLLGQLSPKQIRDAFRAAGYRPEEIEQLSAVMERRIGELKSL